MIEWTGDLSFTIGDTRYLCDQYGAHIAANPTAFCLLKMPPAVRRYEQQIAARQPRRILEVGVMEGASTALLAQLAQPERLVAVDIDPAPAKLRQWVDAHDYPVTVYGHIDQADRELLGKIVDAEFDGPLDMVLDDASHLYSPSAATFHALFPRLRSGGVYYLEDWATGLRDGAAEPLVRLLHDILQLKATTSGLVGNITVTSGVAEIERL